MISVPRMETHIIHTSTNTMPEPRLPRSVFSAALILFCMTIPSFRQNYWSFVVVNVLTGALYSVSSALYIFMVTS